MLRSLPFHQLLLLHSPVLKPYFHLSLRQIEHVSQLHSPLARDVRVHDELALQPARLRARVRDALLASAGGEFDDGRPVLVRVVVRKRVGEAGDVRRENRRGDAARGQRRRLS